MRNLRKILEKEPEFCGRQSERIAPGNDHIADLGLHGR